jgi:TatD DNase family protein
MFTDSHCHLASHRFNRDEIPALLSRAQAAGVHRIITLATCLGDIAANLELAGSPGVGVCLGIHPCDVHHAPDDAVERLRPHLADDRVLAVGETGLDYYHPAPDGWHEDAFRERQRGFLHHHFALAREARLNVVIHTRDKSGDASFRDALAIYQEYHREVRAVFHCFIGPWENAARVLDLGGILSFGGVATFKNAAQVKDTLRKCPPGTFMLETDSPYLAPEPHRGKRNEPACVRDIAAHVALLRGESPAELSAHTERTVAGFFRIPDGSRGNE